MSTVNKWIDNLPKKDEILIIDTIATNNKDTDNNQENSFLNKSKKELFGVGKEEKTKVVEKIMALATTQEQFAVHNFKTFSPENLTKEMFQAKLAKSIRRCGKNGKQRKWTKSQKGKHEKFKQMLNNTNDMSKELTNELKSQIMFKRSVNWIFPRVKKRVTQNIQ